MAVAKKAKAKSKVGKMKIGAITFSQKECGLSKASANQSAEVLRAKNHMARVIKNVGGGYCVFEGPVSKTIAARNKAATVTGTKKRKTTTRRKRA